MKPEEVFQSTALPFCSLVIPTWQRAGLLHATLKSILQQSYPNFEVIVVSDGEDDATRALPAQLQSETRIRWFFHAQNRGQGAARNTGAREASGEFLLFLDDDTLAEPYLICRHIERHLAVNADRLLAVVGRIAEARNAPLPLHTDQKLQVLWEQALETYATQLTTTGVDSVSDAFESTVAFGLNCSIRRAVFLTGGGFNEALRVTDEDLELGLRLYRSGVETVYEPAAVVIHQSTKDLTAYLRRCWGASGILDVHRVLEMGERNPQTRRLLAIHRGYLLDRLAARLCWSTAGSLVHVANFLEKTANSTGSHLILGAWGRTCQAAEYWSGAKAAGCTLPRLKAAAGRSKCSLMLHSVNEPKSTAESSYYVSPRRFHRLMRWFHSTGYKTCTLAQWLEDEVPNRHVLLTFDDAYDDLYEELLPLVIEHHYTPVIYLVANHIGASSTWDQASGLRARNLLTLAQIREMQKYGVEFGSHSLSHPYLPDISDAQLQEEVTESKLRLEELLGVEVTSFAYPYGGVDRRVRSAVAEAGYKAAFTTEPGLNWWNDPLCQRRAGVNDYTSLLSFALKLRGGRSLAESVAARLRSLEQGLPTNALRKLARGLRGLGHESFNRLLREGRDRVGK